jgi:hypothetical protein
MSKTLKAKVLLHFPGASFFVTTNNRIYALTPSGTAAYEGKVSDIKSVYGKHAFTVICKPEGKNHYDFGYAVTYEIENDALVSARFLTRPSRQLTDTFDRVSGALADQKELDALNQKIANEEIEIIRDEEPPHIIHAAALPDGRQLVLVAENDIGQQHTLYMVENGTARALDVKDISKQRLSFLIFLEDNTRIELPDDLSMSNTNRGPLIGFNKPEYTETEMHYIPLKESERFDMKRFGIQRPEVKPYYDLFHPKWPSL